MSTPAFFSIAISLYNKEAYIAMTLNTVLEQTFKDFEVVIVDDGSTDNSLKIVKQFNDQRIKIFTQSNQGASAARNMAISKCTGAYIAVLDADDVWTPKHLENLHELITLFPEAAMYCTGYQLKKTSDYSVSALFSFKHEHKPLLVRDYFMASMFFGIATSSSTAFKKDLFIEVGAYDTHMKNGEDTDLWIRLGLQGPVAFHPSNTVTYNSYDNSSLSSANLYRSRAILLDKYTDQENYNESLKSYLNLNRYSIAIDAKRVGDLDFYRSIVAQINTDELLFKQRFLLLLPSKALQFLFYIQKKLIKHKLYISSFN